MVVRNYADDLMYIAVRFPAGTFDMRVTRKVRVQHYGRPMRCIKPYPASHRRPCLSLGRGAAPC